MMKQSLLFSLTLPLLCCLFHCSTTLAQSPAQAPAPAAQAPAAPTPAAPTPAAPAPAVPVPAAVPPAPPMPTVPVAPAGQVNIFKILDKAGKFKILIRLLKRTQVGNRINTQINKLNEGLTVFAPTDSAFSSLKTGSLNSLNDGQQVELALFHVLPTFLPTSQFQTVSNPLRTQAGDPSENEYPFYVTTSGSQVNVSTGIVNATVDDTIYSDNQLAVYQVDKVLLPVNIFKSAPTVVVTAQQPAPAPETTEKKSPTTISNSPCSHTRHGIFKVVFVGVAVIAAFSL